MAWSCGRRPGRGGGSQAGWWRGELGGFVVSLLCLLARGGRRQGEAPGGLGRTGGLPAQELGRLLAPGKFSLLCFIVLFSFINIFCHCFEFKQIQTMSKNSSEYFYFPIWTFPKAHKTYQGYLKLYSNGMNIIQIQIAINLNSKSQK